MSNLRRLTTALLALGFAVLPPAVAAPAAAEPTPTPAPPCKADSLKLTVPSDIAVAPQPDTYVSRSAIVQNTTGYYYNDLVLAFEIWPDQGNLIGTPKLRFTGTGGTQIAVALRLVSTPRPAWRATGLKPPKVWPTGTPSYAGFELAFPSTSPVTTYSTKLTLTAGVCGATVLASRTGMRFGFMTSGTASVPPKPSASAKASAKPTRKPGASPNAAESSEEAVQPPDETPASEASPVEGSDADLASGESGSDGGSPLPWLAGLGVAGLFVAGGLLFRLRRRSYEDEDEDDD
jgi:hypothetical protein